jgi:RNA polymerase sigma-70 factor (ECF subfamily)
VEARFARELATSESPESLFERAWAVAIIDEAMRRLQHECARHGRLRLFQEIQPCLEGDHDAGSYAEIARALGTTEGTIGVTVSRMRRRYLELLRSVILQTVGSPEEVEEELRHLLRVLKG